MPVFGFAPFRLIHADDPDAVLFPPSRSVRPPSRPKLVKLNAAPPCAFVVPEPLCVPPVTKLPVPLTVSVPEPLSSPPDCVSEPVVTVWFAKVPKVAVPPVTLSNPVPVPPFLAAVRQAAIMTDAESNRVSFAFAKGKLTL